MSAKSAPEILSLKDEHTLRFLNSLIVGFCNSSAKFEECWFGIILLLTAPPEQICVQSKWTFYQKMYKLLEQVCADINHILNV